MSKIHYCIFHGYLPGGACILYIVRKTSTTRSEICQAVLRTRSPKQFEDFRLCHRDSSMSDL